MPSRRPHTKSRLGCLTCKTRRVKCDQQRPICSSCSRLGKQCTWAEDAFVQAQTEYDQAPKPDSNQAEQTEMSEAALQTPQPAISDDVVEDMRFLHHYSTKTSLTLSEEPHKQALWQHNVPKYAFKHGFLLHGLLSVAALHLHTSAEASEKFHLLDVAKRHYSEALSQYLPRLEDINRDNCHALFIFSILSGVISYALSQLLDPFAQSEQFIDKIIEAFDLLRGNLIILERARDWLADSDIAAFRGTTNANPINAPVNRQMWGPKDALTALLGHVQTIAYADAAESGSSSDPSRVPDVNRAYISSIENLFPILPTSENEPPKVSTVIKWPVMVDPGYIGLLKKRDPTTLVVLNHYGTVLHCLTNFWWLSGVGSRIHAAVQQVIEKDWRPYLNMSSWQVAKSSVFARNHLRATGWSDTDGYEVCCPSRDKDVFINS